MQKSFVTLLAIGLGIMGCSHHTKADCISNHYPKEYQSVVDSMREQGRKNPHLSSEYFLYDITGDGIPELWIKVGTCEADTKLLAFTFENGNVSKIYDGDGGHSDYFIYKGQLIGVMCNTGVGVVITYNYDGKRVHDSEVGFSVWNDECRALSEPRDSIADEKLKYWEDNSDKYIELRHL